MSVSVDLRGYAAGQPCQIRLEGVCNHDPATTVLAHFRMAGLCGMGIKPIDAIGAHSCSSCHDACEGRLKTDFEHEYLRCCHMAGVLRTLDKLVREGIIKW